MIVANLVATKDKIHVGGVRAIHVDDIATRTGEDVIRHCQVHHSGVERL